MGIFVIGRLGRDKFLCWEMKKDGMVGGRLYGIFCID